MIKKIIAGVCLLFTSLVFSQQNNASPYSYYGIGDTKTGTVDTRAMGGLGIYPDSIHINLQNPATYSALRLTTFTVGATNARTNFKTDNESESTNRTTVDYVAVALPFKKLAISFGLMPYSAVGYKVQSNGAVDPNDGFARSYRFEGSGGVNRVYGGAGYAITKNFSVGADFQYNFGNIETKSITTIPDAELQYYTRETNDASYHGISLNFGAVYKARISKYNVVASATYAPGYTLQGSSNRQLATISLSSNDAETVIDEIDINSVNADIKMPSKITFGGGFGEVNKWFAGAEYTYKEAGTLGSRFDNATNAGYQTGQKFTLGGFYIPKYYSFTSYFSRVTYRAGLKYEQTGLMINNESINDYALTLGMGFPLGGIGGSNLNIGAEIGKRGTTSAGLVQENYANIFVGISINDKWFVKRRYE